MQKERISYLYHRFLNEELTIVEQKEFEAIFSDQADQGNLEALADQDWDRLHVDHIVSLSEDKLKVHFDNIIAQPQQRMPKRIKFHVYTSVAAAIILVAFGVWIFNRTNREITPSPNLELAYKNDIAPGKNTATLTLANGKKILINEALAGNIATESGVKISKTASGQIIYEITNVQANETAFNTLSTARGEQAQVRLPDGSVVFLNAESSLRYPTSFENLSKREVALTGEGYFEVAVRITRNKKMPFLVTTKNQTIEVLGTHFNVNAYQDNNNAKTTLLEGSVQVATGWKKQLIVPGQQAITANGQIKVEEADLELAVAWKNNKLMFDSQTIQEIMKMVERWYDVKVIYEGEIPNTKYVGDITKFSNISKVLRILESNGDVKFRIEGRNVYVSR